MKVFGNRRNKRCTGILLKIQNIFGFHIELIKPILDMKFPHNITKKCYYSN